MSIFYLITNISRLPSPYPLLTITHTSKENLHYFCKTLIAITDVLKDWYDFLVT